MAICEPTPNHQWAKSSSTENFEYLRYAPSWWRAAARARSAAEDGQPAAVAATKTAICGECPEGCTCNTSALGPKGPLYVTFGWWGGTVTAYYRTRIDAKYECDTVPEGASEAAS